MSALAQTTTLPPRVATRGRDAVTRIGYELVVGLATAEDLAVGMERVVALARLASGAARVEWWAADGSLVSADGAGSGERQTLELPTVGEFVFYGGCIDLQLESALTSLEPIVRRRRADERLADAAVQLARRNEALEDFAALVAHELKTPLHAALVADDASDSVRAALELVETLLETARGSAPAGSSASVSRSLEDAVHDLDPHDVEITSDVGSSLPLSPESLRVILRNLLGNALAAGAHHIHIATVQSEGSLELVVDDDGAGLSATASYTSGSGLGLNLSRRIAARFGGGVELAPRPVGGTRATLAFGESS